MPVRDAPAVVVYWLATAGLVLSAATGASAVRSDDSAPLVYAAEVDGIIHPMSAEFMVVGHRSRRHRAGVAARLHPPDARRAPGLHADDRQPHDRGRARPSSCSGRTFRRPCRVGWVHPRARRRRRGDGAGHPHRRRPSGVGQRRSKLDETMAKKAASDVAAYARSLAESPPAQRACWRRRPCSRVARSPIARRWRRRRP